MHCAACAYNVEKALKSVVGVTDATVNATSKRAKVTLESEYHSSHQSYSEALLKAGYSALPANEIFQIR
jgi:P-type Cu2+ transporter